VSRKTLRRVDAVIVAVVVIGMAAAVGSRFRPVRPTLVVWSCGGNYDFLKAYAAAFERREGCRVRYTAAPVQYLLEEAVYGDRMPDVIVGRAGPGWAALKGEGKMLEGPVFFGIDPLGIAVPAGNPKGVRSIEDVGRSGVRVAASPRAMRPKGKVIALLMGQMGCVFPGLTERWENNAVVRPKCGRFLLRPLLDGRADCAIAPRSICFYPSVRGKVEFIPIPPEYLVRMKKGRASMPQCAGILRTPHVEKHLDLARRFVHGLRESRDLLHEFGYLALTDPEAQPLAPLLKVSVPKDMPGWQVRLAEYLEQYGISGEARRRYLKVVYTFGPNRYTARALYRAALISLAKGAAAAARLDLERVVTEFPPPRPNEYDSRVLHYGLRVPGLEPKPYAYWIREAHKTLRGIPRRGDGREGSRILRDPRVHALFPVLVSEGDPPKNGTREFGLGLHLLVTQDFEFATRDLLKVATLNHPSRWMPDAEYLLGVCALRRGLPETARRQWDRIVREFPDSRAAAAARLALASLPQKTQARALPAMPSAPERLDTHPLRGITYGMRLWEHHLPLFTFKEMVKVVSGVYGPCSPDVRAEARFRAGVALIAVKHPEAAVRQWKQCIAAAPESKWAVLARERLASTPSSGADSPQRADSARSVDAGRVRQAKKAESGKKSPGSFVVRFRVAEEFRKAGVYEGDQIVQEYLKVLTVARPPRGKGEEILAAAAFHLAEVLHHTGRDEPARTWLRRVLERYPDSPWAAQARSLASALAPKESGAKSSVLSEKTSGGGNRR